MLLLSCKYYVLWCVVSRGIVLRQWFQCPIVKSLSQYCTSLRIVWLFTCYCFTKLNWIKICWNTIIVSILQYQLANINPSYSSLYIFNREGCENHRPSQLPKCSDTYVCSRQFTYDELLIDMPILLSRGCRQSEFS